MTEQVAPLQIPMFEDPARLREGDLPEHDSNAFASADSSSVQLPHVLRAINVGERLPFRWELMRELSRQIPLDQHNLPMYLYRADLLDPTLLLGPATLKQPLIAHEVLNSAILKVTWDQGFPTVHQEDPLWAKLQFEPDNAFNSFLMYAEQSGIRQLHLMQHESRDVLLEWYHLYSWAPRAKALDLFRSAHHFRLREKRILDLEDNHWTEGEKIMKRLQNAIANKGDEALNEMDVDKLISSMEKVAKIQRSAVGLSTSGGDVTSPKVTSVEVAVRQASEDGTQVRRDDEHLPADLFDDESTLAAAQDLILKVTTR